MTLNILAERANKNDLISKLAAACKAADVQDQLSTQAMDALEAEPENEELDAVADKVYKEFWTTCRKIAEMLVDITGGMIEEKIALHMALYKRAEIIRIYIKTK